MTWTATATNKFRDPSNFNIVAEITYTNGVTTIVERFAGVDLTDAQIAVQAGKRITNVLEVGDVALAALTTGPITPTKPSTVITAEQQAVLDAQKAFQDASRLAQIKALNDPAALTAYNNLQTALAAAAALK